VAVVCDASVRRQVMSGPVLPARALVELDPAEALELLASVRYGRIVFTRHALPAIRPVNHLVDNGEVIIRTRLSGKITEAVGANTDSTGTVVAYEADLIDPVQRLGWSVTVTGRARPITDATRIARYEQALLPWVDPVMDTVIGIRADIVTGFRLLAPD